MNKYMKKTIDYAKISKNTMEHLYAGYKSLNDSPLQIDLKALIELYVSQINGCMYCCNIHANEALKLGISEDKINDLSKFTTSLLFSDAEKEVLKFAKVLTKLDKNKRIQDTELGKYFSEREIVDIAICISLMNAFNRLAISMKNYL
jgi:AhpD family alkylhydroperoxidase